MHLMYLPHRTLAVVCLANLKAICRHQHLLLHWSILMNPVRGHQMLPQTSEKSRWNSGTGLKDHRTRSNSLGHATKWFLQGVLNVGGMGVPMLVCNFNNCDAAAIHGACVPVAYAAAFRSGVERILYRLHIFPMELFLVCHFGNDLMVNPDQTNFGTPPIMEPCFCLKPFVWELFHVYFTLFSNLMSWPLWPDLSIRDSPVFKWGHWPLNILNSHRTVQMEKHAVGFVVSPAFTSRWLPPQLLLQWVTLNENHFEYPPQRFLFLNFWVFFIYHLPVSVSRVQTCQICQSIMFFLCFVLVFGKAHNVFTSNLPSSCTAPRLGSAGGPKHSDSLKCHRRLERTHWAIDCLGAFVASRKMGHDDHAEHSFQENSANKNLGEKVVLGTLQESDVRL